VYCIVGIGATYSRAQRFQHLKIERVSRRIIKAKDANAKGNTVINHEIDALFL
jgi:hypothetical protein